MVNMRMTTYLHYGLVIVTLLLAAGPAAAFPDSPANTGAADTACSGYPGTLCFYGALSPVELRAANAAAAAGASVPVEQVPTDLGYYGTLDYWKLVNGPISIYDGPNGNQTNSIEPGFNYITVLGWDGEWAQINYGQWIHQSHMEPATVSTFAGVLTPAQPDRLFGWMLLDTKPSPAPGTPADESAAWIRRYTHITVYATVKVDRWEWYLIAPDQWIEQRRVSLVHKIERPDGVSGRWVAVDLYEQNVVAYDNDAMVWATLISSGLAQWPTREGLFEVWSRVENGKMSGAEGQPDYYYLEDVPWTLYFDDGRSFHGTYWHDHFGYRHSHGCVNLSITDSAWLFNWVDQDHTWVYVYSTGDYVK